MTNQHNDYKDLVKAAKIKYDFYFMAGTKKLVANEFAESANCFRRASEYMRVIAEHSETDFKETRTKKSIELAELAVEIDRKILFNEANKEENEQCQSNMMLFESDIPNIKFEDVAGLEEVKLEVYKKAVYPQKYKEIYKKFRKKNNGGILLYGVPGTGKTMIAQAIANEIKAQFFLVKCSDLLDKYCGQNEKNIANLFATARKYPLSIIFFDEFEALGATRGKDEGQVTKRIVPQLLNELQGFAKKSDEDHQVIVIAATNRPWDIDSAFMRPGRFTSRIEVSLPDYEARKQIVFNSLEGIEKADDVSLEKIAEETEGYSAADVDNICEMLKDYPIQRLIETKSGGFLIKSDIEDVLKKVPCSVRPKDVLDIARFSAENL